MTNELLDSFADSISIRLRDEESASAHTITAVKEIEKVIKREIRKGAFISEDQLTKMITSLVVDGQPDLFSIGNDNGRKK